MNDVALARSIATQAAMLLRRIQADPACPKSELGTRGDQQSNQLILDRLRDARPYDFVLSEETPDDTQRCKARRVWIIDPLDGTREFSAGLNEWAVHIGLSIDGVPSVGAVALPALDKLFATDDPPLPRSHRPPPAHRPRIVVSRSRTPDIATKVADALDGEIILMGSAGAKAMAVVDGRADIYLHDGGQYEWDNCAPAAVALAAGLYASRIDGSPLVYNAVNPFLPDLLICRQEWAQPVLDAIAA